MLRPLLLLLLLPVLAHGDQAPGVVTSAACAGWKVATPEIISQPGVASPQSNFYALGTVGYFLVTGRNVFEGSGSVEICAKHLSDEPVPPSQRSGLEVPQDLEALILDCLAKDPTQRPVDAASVGFRLVVRCGSSEAVVVHAASGFPA